MEKLCELCNKTIKSNYKRHYKICLKNGKKRSPNKNDSPRKGKTYAEIFGIEKAEELKNKLSKSWTKKTLSEESKLIASKKLSEHAKRRKIGGYKPGSGRGKSGWYKGYWCDSSYELVWVIYNLEHNIQFKRNTKKFEYSSSGSTHYWIPDFILTDNSYVEIKGYWTSVVDDKLKNFPYPISILYKKNLNQEFNYVESTYGKNFIKLYEGNTSNKKCKCGELLYKTNKSGKCISCIRKNHKKQNTENKIKRNKIGPKFCQSCDKKINSPRLKQLKCGTCWQEQQIKNSKIPYDLNLLKTQVQEYGYKKVGQIYGVSDNAIRKRIIKLETNRLDEEPIWRIGKS